MLNRFGQPVKSFFIILNKIFSKQEKNFQKDAKESVKLTDLRKTALQLLP